MVRTSIAALAAVSILFTGIYAISQSAQQAKPGLSTNAQNSSYHLATDVFSGVTYGSSATVWFGVAAIIIVALGILVTAGASGGR